MTVDNQSPQILTDFLSYLHTVKGKSEKTVHEYYLDLRMFFRFLKQYRGLDNGVPFSEIPISDVYRSREAQASEQRYERYWSGCRVTCAQDIGSALFFQVFDQQSSYSGEQSDAESGIPHSAPISSPFFKDG